MGVSSAAIVDAQLVQQVQAGDGAAFGALFEQYQTPIFSYLYRLVGNRDEASDLTQEAFIKAFQALPRMGADLRFTPWLYRIATNVAISALRRRRIIQWLPLLGRSGEEREEPHAAPQFPAQLAEHELVQRTLRQLPRDYVVCLVLHDQEGFGTEEVAGILNISPGALRVKLFRARRAFREIYLRESGQP